MKLSSATSYLLVVLAALAVLSTEGSSLRGERSLSLVDLSSNTGHFDGLHRRMEDNAGDDAVQASDDAVVEDETSKWDNVVSTANKTITTALDPDTYTDKYNEVTDTYNNMSRSTQIWTIVLAVWFATLLLSTFCYCCCGKKKIKKKGLNQKLMRQEDYY